MRNAQLADLLRPQTIDDIVGQKHLFGERGVIRRMMEGGRLTNILAVDDTHYYTGDECRGWIMVETTDMDTQGMIRAIRA